MGVAVHAICNNFPGGNHHLHIALPASYAAHLSLLFCRRWAAQHKKDFVKRIGFVPGFTLIFVAMGALSGTNHWQLPAGISNRSDFYFWIGSNSL